MDKVNLDPSLGSAQQAEPLHVTHRPLIRNAINLLGMRRPVAPDVEQVIADLEAMLGGLPTPAGPAGEHWLEVAQLAEPAPAQDGQHFDDRAVDRFAAVMKAKMAAARAKGRHGWFNRLQCPGKRLARMLIEHLSKGNEGTFEDIANFCMMLHQRGEDPQLLADAARPAQTEQQHVAVPEGWRLVPVKPTIEMVEAGYEEGLGAPDRSEHARVIEQYDAMLASAPVTQPAQTELVGALRGMLDTYGPPESVAADCVYPADHPITKARAALTAQGGE